MATSGSNLEAQSLSIGAEPLPVVAPLSPRPPGPPRDSEWAEGTAPARTSSSRRRKPVGQGQAYSPQNQTPAHGNKDYGWDQSNSAAAPVAPEAPEPPPAPKGPPISYRDPYTNGQVGSRSFADRARDLADEGTHLPSGRTPEPSASFKDHTPFVQATKPDVLQPQRAEESEEEAIPRVRYEQPQPPPQQQQPPIQPQKVQTTRLPFGESPPANRSAPRNEPRVGTQPDDTNAAAAAVAARMGSVRGNSKPQKLDWAVDHSPLQRLEVKLNDLSKEEKRARMEAAEQRHREREKTRKQRESQTLEEGSRSAPRGQSGPEATRSGANETRPRKRSLEQSGDIGSGLAREQSGRRVVSDSQGPITSKTTPRSDQYRGSRIPRPVEVLAAAGTAAGAADAIHAVGRSTSQSKRQRTSLDSSVPRLGLGGDSNPSTRHYDGSAPVPQADRRRSTDDRGVRFHPFDESINKKYAAQGTAPRGSIPRQQAALYTERVNNAEEPTPPHAVLAHKGGPKYEVPPQSVAGGKARQLLGFGGDQAQGPIQDSQQHSRHHFMPHLHRHQQQSSPNAGPQASRHLDEWRQGKTARLQLSDLTAKREPQKPGDKAMPWWESPKASQKRGSRSSSQPPPEVEYFDGANEDTNPPTIFDPPLFMKCGPLLRYTGMKRDKLAPPAGAPAQDRETWRGSVMIVTVDADSVYEPAPTLRLFHQPMDLLAEPPMHVTEGKEPLPSEYVDPVAGMPKISRDGSTVYVKPAEDFDEGADYSRDETDNGLFEKMRTANVPTGYGRPDTNGGESPISRSTSAGRRAKMAGRFREVKGIRLHAERGFTFWRFTLEVELGDKQARIAYRINKGASVGFWVPARGQSMNIMFHSCNGFSSSVKPGDFGGPDPLWRDVLNAHQTKPFHVMIGGGDQIYNDRVTTETTIFQEWLELKNPSHKREAPFTLEMRDELESFYLNRYAMWFSQGMFGMANSQIPMVNIWDDHDIIDGFGSYPDSFMSSPVFSGLGAVAFKYYMLYQHQSVPDELEADEPSWLLGASPGPYINYLSRNIFVSLGKHVAFLGLDCRTERRRDEILSENSYDMIFDRCRREIVTSDTKHLIVLLGVPIAYPRLEWLENILTSRVMDPVKALSKLGVLGNLTNKFDGGYEILDDLDDHWTAKHHKEERRWVIEELQELAAEKSVRITMLGGDVHLAAVGQFYSNKKLNIPKDRDHRYMPNIVSSAIVNTPPTDMMADFINRRDKKVHHLDAETDEDMIPMFTHDVDGKRRNNKKLLPRRNWCSISEYAPGMTPPPSPPMTASEPGSPGSESIDEQGPRKSFSLGNSRPAQLLRRLSSANKGNRDDLDPSLPYSQQRPPDEDDLTNDSYFPPGSGTARVFDKMQRKTSAPPIPTRPTSQFHRRPTNLSEKAAKKGNLPDNDGEISLQGGLDIRINCEIKQGDPIGSTESYRLLVPALWYTGDMPAPVTARKPSMLQRLSSIKTPLVGKIRGQESESEFSEDEEAPPQQFQPRPQPSAAAPSTTGVGSSQAVPVGGQSAPSATRSAPAISHNATHPMGNSVSVESLPQRPRRQSLLQRFGSLRDKLQPNRSREIDDSYSEYTNDEYAPNDDAAMMQQGSMARQSRPPVTGSIDSVSRKPRRASIAERFGSIGRRLSQMGRRKDKDWDSETGSYTGSETETEADYQSDYLGSGDLSRPGRQPMTSPPGSRGQQMASPPVSRSQTMASPPVTRQQPPVIHQKPQKPQKQTQFTAPAAAPFRTSSQRATTNKADEIPDPFKPRPKVAMSPPPQTQKAQFYPPPQPQYASTCGGSTDAMVGFRQPTHTKAPESATQRSASQRASTGQAYDNRRSGGVYASQQPHVGDEDEDDEDESATDDSELDSIDDLDSLKAAAKNRQRKRNIKNMSELLGAEVNQTQAQAPAQRSSSMRAPVAGGGLKRKDISKFFGDDDPAAGEGMRRRVTDPGTGGAGGGGGGKRASVGYSGVEAWNGSGKKWWKLGK